MSEEHKHEPFVKSEREQKINALCDAINEASDETARHALGKELLKVIE
jgi:hypothetical protein